MRAIRKLYFQNAAGERRGLNGENGMYATDLAGFGFSLGTTFSDLGRGFFPVSGDSSEPQNSLAFTVVLTRSPYTTHQSLVDWLAAAGTLTIVYNPTGTREYCRDVVIKFITKGELNQMGWLELPCSFQCITPWYLPVPTALTMSGSGKDTQKRYPHRYPYRYGADNTASLRTLVAGTGHIPGAIRLTYQGGITNPRIRLVGNLSGKTYGVCSLSAALGPSDTLEYCSLHENSYVRQIAADGTVTDLLDALDLSLSPFFHIPVDEPCTLSVESDAPFVGRAALLIYYYYRSV